MYCYVTNYPITYNFKTTGIISQFLQYENTGVACGLFWLRVSDEVSVKLLTTASVV